ncbi:MAG TPA: hypothetical protein VMW27_16065, partial [Thermoanaerobaculia bacterium]|nr:hypothetical protein [Thermoanaerobaculia bacterium]
MGFLDSAITSVGRELAQTAVSALEKSTGVDVGGTLNYLFGNGQETGGANLDALSQAIEQKFAGDLQQLEMLQAEIYQQDQALAALSAQLSGIASALTQITGIIQNIEQLLSGIGQEQLYQSWQNVDNEMTNYLVSIDTNFRIYSNYLSSYGKTPASEVAKLAENILNGNDGPLDGLSAIHSFMMGSGQGRGALQLWSLMVTPLVQQGLLDYRLAVQQYFQYYEKLTYAQLQAASLVMEAYNFNDDPINAKKAWDQYRQQILDQEDTFIQWLVPLVYSGVIGGIFVTGNNPYDSVNYTAYDAAVQLNPRIQYVRGDTDVDAAFYTPSSIFTAAEQLLANLYVTTPSSRRIVVYMLYPNGWGIDTLLNGVELTLSSVSSSTTISSASHNRLGSPFPFPTVPGPWNYY